MPCQKKNVGQKKWCPRFLEYAEAHVLKFPKKMSFWGFFCFFLWTKYSIILSSIKQKILGEIMQSNGIKSPQNLFFKIFCKFLPYKGNFLWKVSSKMIYTFYLKHQNKGFINYVFCRNWAVRNPIDPVI